MTSGPPELVPAFAPLTRLSEEEQLFRVSVREFARREVAPKVRAMDEAAHFDPSLLRQLFDVGLMAIDIPEQYGGQGGSFFNAVIAVEELAMVDPSAAVIVDVQNTLVTNALLRWASEDQRARYLPPLATHLVSAYALSEPGSGSDAFALRTTAAEDGDHYILNGRKMWITNAAEAGLFMLFANANPALGHRGITCFLVDRETPGFQVGRKEDKLGIRASSTCELILDNCRVPRANVVGEVGLGYRIAIETLNEGRIAIGGQMLGVAQAALDHAVSYARQRRQFGQPIGAFQGVQFELAEMAVDVEAARLLVYNAARLRDAGLPFVTEAAMAKYHASQAAERCASRAIEVLGGVGFTREYPVEKLYRDAKIGRIYEGTSNIQKITIAKALLGKLS
ncbi:MAG: acyl-CoA dehydrogenase [Acidobacteria bacterium]|nr:acyl-CoA dehydrogenase [Acidobacteriota bacterium]